MNKEAIELFENAIKVKDSVNAALYRTGGYDIDKYCFVNIEKYNQALTLLKQQPPAGDEMTKKFNALIEEIKSMFVVSQAMAKNSFDSTLQSMEPVEGETYNPDPPPKHEYPIKQQPPAGEFNKEAIELLEKNSSILRTIYEEKEIPMPDDLEKLSFNNAKALTLLKQPECKTCGDSGRVPTFDQASQLADAEPCPDCQQPPAGEWTIDSNSRPVLHILNGIWGDIIDRKGIGDELYCTDGDIKTEIHEEWRKIVVEGLEIFNNQALALLKQQPPAGEWTDIFRKFLDYPDTALNPRDDVQWQDMSFEACDIIDTAEALNKDLLDALEKYGEHEPGCMRGDACNCGLKATIAKAQSRQSVTPVKK